MNIRILINDNTLGILLRAYLVAREAKSFPITIEHRRGEFPGHTTVFNHLNLLNIGSERERPFEVKTLVSDRTIVILRALISGLGRDIAMLPFTGDSSGVSKSRLKKEQLEKLAKKLEDYYKKQRPLEYEDLLIGHAYPELDTSLIEQVSISKAQLSNLTELVSNYSKAYVSRDGSLQGQERLPLAQVLSELLLKKINSTGFIDIWGLKNFSIISTGQTYFCHSLLYLNQSKQITLHRLNRVNFNDQGQNTYIWEAVIDNNSIEKRMLTQSTQVDSVVNVKGGPQNSVGSLSASIAWPPDEVPKDHQLASNDEWLIAKRSISNRFAIYHNGHENPMLVSKKARWLKLFIKYVRDTRLTVNEILDAWNSTKKGGWKSNEKLRSADYVPDIHKQISNPLRTAFGVDVKFNRSNGTSNANIFYKLVASPLRS